MSELRKADIVDLSENVAVVPFVDYCLSTIAYKEARNSSEVHFLLLTDAYFNFG